MQKTVRSYHQVPEAKMLLQKHCAKGAVIFTLTYLKMKGAKVAHMLCEFHSHNLYFLNFHFGNVFVSAESTLKKNTLLTFFPPLSIFLLKNKERVRESPHCLPKLHPSGAQINKIFSIEIRFLNFMQEFKGAQRILIKIGVINSHKPGNFHQNTIYTFILTELQNRRSNRLGSLSYVFKVKQLRIILRNLDRNSIL